MLASAESKPPPVSAPVATATPEPPLKGSFDETRPWPIAEPEFSIAPAPEPAPELPLHWFNIEALPEGMRAYAYWIIKCESRFNPSAKNKVSSASGLWQLTDVHADKFTAHGWNWETDRFDPYKNTVIAIELWEKQGYGPWDSSAYCWSD